ncbi:MAG: hypothetical protein K6E98_10630 [Lachnospiraceae bacterium]|nr:hypothetical protein [Lachnospiraceae bacterium]
MSDDTRVIPDEELVKVSGGWSEEEEKKKKEALLHGKIVKDALGNVTFTDKTGNITSFTSAEWNTLRARWDYTGNPEYFMETIDGNELKGLL